MGGGVFRPYLKRSLAQGSEEQLINIVPFKIFFFTFSLYLPRNTYIALAANYNKYLASNKNHSFPFYFLEPLQWMEVCNSVSESRLFCAKCGSKLGTYSWDAAIKCPCGASMAPGFFINLNRVDKCTMHKDIEAVI